MSILGEQLIAGQWHKGLAGHWQAVNPVLSECIAPNITMANLDQVNTAINAAADAADDFAETTIKQRADFLNTIAEHLIHQKSTILERFCLETGYPLDRAESEFDRTIQQLYLYAKSLLTGHYLDVRIDHAEPDRKPFPRPELRTMNIPIGPVAVFGSANFPLAYSVAGGDTVSALAAGCPVIVKGHPSHPGCGELVARAINQARIDCKLPGGVFSLLQGEEATVGATLVRAIEVKAVGFTGSFRGGMALYRMANQRPVPIPVFAEMGSLNPVILLPGALQSNSEAIAKGYIQSLTLHTGQYCVNPGLIIAIDDEALKHFTGHLRKFLGNIEAGVMLNSRIHRSYLDRTESMRSELFIAASGRPDESERGYYAQALLLEASSTQFLENPQLQEEVFGPAAIVVRCPSHAELLNVIEKLPGQLTGSIHGTQSELAPASKLLKQLQKRIGRFVFNGFPTGVEVSNATVHGGPFPACTDSRFTSVGTNAIARFVRPVCYQNCPSALLPPPLREENPWKIKQTINGLFS